MRLLTRVYGKYAALRGLLVYSVIILEIHYFNCTIVLYTCFCKPPFHKTWEWCWSVEVQLHAVVNGFHKKDHCCEVNTSTSQLFPSYLLNSVCIGLQPIWWIFLVLFEYGINRCLQLSWWTGLALVSPVGCLAGLIWSGAHSSWCALWLSDFFPHMYTLPGRSHWCNWWPSRWLAVWWEHKDWKVWDRGLGYLIIAIT